MSSKIGSKADEFRYRENLNALGWLEIGMDGVAVILLKVLKYL